MAISMACDVSMIKNNPVQFKNKPLNDEMADNAANKNICCVKRELVSEDQYKKNVEKAREELIGHSTHLEFSVHKFTHEIMVKVVDDETNEVLKEIPPEKILDLVAEIWKIAGLVMDNYI